MDSKEEQIIAKSSDIDPLSLDNQTSGLQRSPVWEYFTLVSRNPDISQCKNCSSVLKLTRGTTSPMLNHLRNKHSELWKKCIEKKVIRPAKKKNTDNNSKLDDETELAEEQSSIKRKTLRDFFKINPNDAHVAICNSCQKTIRTISMKNHLLNRHIDSWKMCYGQKNSDEEAASTSTKRRKTISASIDNKNDLDDMVMRMIAKDLRPYTCVEDRGFKELLEQLLPDYNLPSPSKIEQELAPKLYDKTKSALKINVGKDVESGLLSLAFTTDCWWSRSEDYYMALTAHYITKDFKLKNVTIAVEPIQDEYTPANICQRIEQMLEEWGLLNLDGVPVFFVTDNSKKINMAIAEGGWNHISCFAHTLQSAINSAINETNGVKDLLKKCRRIAAPLKLIQSGKTKWNSEYEMLERLLKLQISLSETPTTPTSVDSLTSDEWKDISYLLEALKPVYKATKISCKEKYPTLSMVMPLIKGIKYGLKKINSIKEQPEENLHINLLKSVETKFAKILDDSLCQKATFLDPRYKNFAFEEEELVEIKSNIKSELCQINRNAIDLQSGNSTQREIREETEFWGFMKAPQEEMQEPPSILLLNIEQELMTYEHMQRISTSNDPIVWWQQKKNSLPLLFDIARRYLSMPATSVESERLISSDEDNVTERFSSLVPGTVSLLVFLYKNLD